MRCLRIFCGQGKKIVLSALSSLHLQVVVSSPGSNPSNLQRKGKKGRRGKKSAPLGFNPISNFSEEQFFLTNLVINTNEVVAFLDGGINANLKVERHTPNQTLANFHRFVLINQPLQFPSNPPFPSATLLKSNPSDQHPSKGDSMNEKPFLSPIQEFVSDSPSFSKVGHVSLTGRVSVSKYAHSSFLSLILLLFLVIPKF